MLKVEQIKWKYDVLVTKQRGYNWLDHQMAVSG